MHQKTRRFQIYIFTFMLFLAFLTRAHAGAPLDLVRTTVDRAIQILKDPKLSSRDKKNERVDRLREALDAIFDYEEMAKRALGPHWRQRTPAEQQEFVKLFHYFLERVYSDKIDLYGGEKVRFGREVMDNEFAQVESTIIQPKGEEIAVVYKLRQVNGQWKVYDAIVENISIVNNYRSQFDRVISSSSYEELVKRLRGKLGSAQQAALLHQLFRDAFTSNTSWRSVGAIADAPKAMQIQTSQIFDGTVSYFILSRGEAELNPFVSAAIDALGLLWALVYWKVFVCALLVILYSIGRYQPMVPLRGLTFVAIVYSALGFYLVFHLIHSA